jgi:hypothetical protein
VVSIYSNRDEPQIEIVKNAFDLAYWPGSSWLRGLPLFFRNTEDKPIKGKRGGGVKLILELRFWISEFRQMYVQKYGLCKTDSAICNLKSQIELGHHSNPLIVL